SMNLEATQTAVRNARETLARLVTERSDFDVKTTMLADERAEIAFAAHTGDAQAKKRLARIHDELTRQSSEIASLDVAIAEVQRLVASAEAHQHRAQETEDARRAVAMLDDLRADAAALDALALALIQKYEQVKDRTRALRGLGAMERPTHELVRT